MDVCFKLKELNPYFVIISAICMYLLYIKYYNI